MTIVVAIKCSDGAVIACDSMLTTGNAQQKGQKIHILDSNQIFAFAGSLSFAERFRSIVASLPPDRISVVNTKYQFANHTGEQVVADFRQTGVDPFTVSLGTVLVHIFNDSHEVCHFQCGSQPHYLDEVFHTIAIGSGSEAALPFLTYLSNILLPNQQPDLKQGKLLSVLAVNYAITTMAGGVGGEIRLAVIERDLLGAWKATQLPSENVQETIEHADTLSAAIRKWRDETTLDRVDLEIPDPSS